MTPAAFLEALHAALRAVEGVGLVHGATCWPRQPDGRLRLLVPSAGWQQDPCVLDPLGLVYLHQTGHVLGLLDGLRCGLALGFSSEDTVDLLQACDGGQYREGTPAAARAAAARYWRVLVTGTLDVWTREISTARK